MAFLDKNYFWREDDPLWYKDALIYELHVRAYYDSDNDGIGDFAGLAQKLDYLQDLGVTTIWLLPFYPSPLRDDGYDISDYTGVHPAYGTPRDVRELLREANSRGLRIITELVLNHTSDQHAWFQRARMSPPGSRWRDFYVWSDTPEKYKEARIIFKDFETSNWAWDPVAKAYYWHRFYSHQPDLNFDNNLVKQAMLRTVNFWLGMGVSGLRLDAVPYLYEREGTNCENLPETHVFLKTLRRHVDTHFHNRMLLAEANQWAEDAAAYFGAGDECQMAFHFPLMPRMFMAIRMEDRFPVIDILTQTPPIPENCQWALFLRNHDELTLEMVTDEERDYMYRMFAHDVAARINLGIRRRLAPLLNNDRKKIELMNGLLFSLPGTPVIYYGDEIGMGDNYYLGDRNGVRTPMQWSPDRNAGFSDANPQKLYLPVNIDPEYHYEAVNVETQQNNPDSLLWWMKRLIALRKRFKALSRGSLEFLLPENRKVLAYVRRYQDETVLVVANLSRLAQHTSIDLARFAGKVPLEAFGRAEFPTIGEAPYVLTLSPHAFYWFSLETRRPLQVGAATAPGEPALATITLEGEWTDLFKHEFWPKLEAVLPSYITQQRWFGGKSRYISLSEVYEIIHIPYDAAEAYDILVRIEYTEGEPEVYQVPIAYAGGEKANQLIAESPQAIIARLKLRGREGSREGVIYDALVGRAFAETLLQSMGRRRRFRGINGDIVTWPTRVYRELRGPAAESPLPAVLKGEQTNNSVNYGNRLILKLYRRLQEGESVELELGRFLTGKRPFRNAPPVAGALEYHLEKDHGEMTLGIMHGYVRNEGDAWRYTLDMLGHYFENVLTRRDVKAPLPGKASLLDLSNEPTPPLVEETIGAYLAQVRLLGQRTAELHLALASAPEDPAFAPEPYTLGYQRSLFHAMRSYTSMVLPLLRQRLPSLPEGTRGNAEKVLSLESEIISRFNELTRRKIAAMRIRLHGDYHLGQVLYTGNDFVIIDFEGEPARSLEERRIKRSPLRDVASMLRSFHYASHAALLGNIQTRLRPEDLPGLQQWAMSWYLWVSATFLKSYLGLMSEPPLLPRNYHELCIMLDAFLLDKAIYEINYELNNRPDWIGLPLQGILQVLSLEEAEKASPEVSLRKVEKAAPGPVAPAASQPELAGVLSPEKPREK